MSFFLDWFTTHIAIVVQALAGLIICITIVFAYRLFFIKSAKSLTADGSESNPTLEFIEEKLNKLLIQQSALKVTASSLTASGDLPQEQMADMTKLKDILKQKENEIAHLKKSSLNETAKSSAIGNESTANAAVKAEAAKQAQTQSLADLKKLNDQLSLYQTQIDDLKSRLSDYEIIAEDIADLQKFKKENELLKSQLSNVGITSTLDVGMPSSLADENTNDFEEEAALTDEEKTLHMSADNEAELEISELLAQSETEADQTAVAIVEATVVEEVPAASVSKPKAAEPSSKQSEIDALFAEFSPDFPITTNAAETTVDAIQVAEEVIDTTLTDNEKNLIDDFSKTQKS